MKNTNRVVFIPLKSCLVNLPHTLTRTLSGSDVAAQTVVVILSWKSKQAYVGWSGHSSSGADTLEIDPAFARNIGLTEATEVTLELRIAPPEAEVVWVEPVSSNDWEIMELHASFLELNFLNQVRAVSTEHPLTLYLNPHTTASIIVRKIEPELTSGDKFAKLSTSAEVVVSPKTRQAIGDDTFRPKSSTSNKAARRAAELKPLRSIFLRALMETNTELRGLNAFLSPDLLRSIGASNYIDVQEVLPPSLRGKSQPNDLIAPSLSPSEKGTQAGITAATRIIVRAHSFEDVPDNHITLSSEVFRALGLVTGSRVKISVPTGSKKVLKLTCHRVQAQTTRKELKLGGKKNTDTVELFKKQLSTLGAGPVTHGMRIGDFLAGLQDEGDWGEIPVLDKLSITSGEDIVLPLRTSPELALTDLKGVDTIASKVLKVCQRHGGVLLYGSRGSGKTSIAAMCAQQLQTRHSHVVLADCSKLSEERVANIKEALNHWFSEAAWYEPSVLMIDDLDRLCPAEVEHADSTRARQLAEIFLSVLRQFTSRHAISILATAQSKEALHSLLVTSHIFDETISLKPPSKVARREIVQSLVDVEEGSLVDWMTIANMTDGYLAGDLKFLTDRAKHEGLMREMSETPEPETSQLKTIDYEKAISGFTPASLRGIKLQKSSVEWKDIGGLEDTRRILLETLEWPTRYAPIFANCPLRLRSGLLLYGYPGCGKTLLASAVASECGLNFIAVKGPEILNKYIGASEKSVRDLFDRAQAAKPCVLFFDEFDSIAPKRGHDSTGVTDRVVNQMLTQMDGAEGLEGVYVLAATSRPDLIDPALLRPGRLDKSLLCNMPTRSDRRAILEALSRKMHVASDVEIDDLAARTEGFSGADLQAVLYNAHLEAIHDVLSKDEAEMSTSQTLEIGDFNKKEPTTFTRFRLRDGTHKTNGVKVETSADLAAVTARIEAILTNTAHEQTSNQVAAPSSVDRVIEISWDNLEKSLSTTKPSISVDERRRLDKVYHDFVDGRSPDGLPDGQVVPGEQRATLA